ncbi:MAG: hypothetical protein ACREU3_11885 [Steroidobacteraceae bacterium]
MTGEAPGGEVMVYDAPEGGARVEVRLDRDTVWLTERQMSELFDTPTDNSGLHVKSVGSDNELEEHATAEEFSVIRAEGSRQGPLLRETA